jgi:DnaA family protein
MITQLTLRVQLRDNATFENFYVGDNETLVQYLQGAIHSEIGSFIYLWGNYGSGRSHLLQACCHQSNHQDLSSIYLSLSQAAQLSPDLFESIEALDLICIDDIDAIAGNLPWEEALFHCYNRIQQANARLVIAADKPPTFASFKLRDLTSRFSSGIIFQVKPLTDEQKLVVLQLRAKIRGINLSSRVTQFLLNHYQRDTTALFEVLEKLDQASLSAKRKLTIPFVKEILRSASNPPYLA